VCRPPDGVFLRELANCCSVSLCLGAGSAAPYGFALPIGEGEGPSLDARSLPLSLHFDQSLSQIRGILGAVFKQRHSAPTLWSAAKSNQGINIDNKDFGFIAEAVAHDDALGHWIQCVIASKRFLGCEPTVTMSITGQ